MGSGEQDVMDLGVSELLWIVIVVCPDYIYRWRLHNSK